MKLANHCHLLKAVLCHHPELNFVYQIFSSSYFSYYFENNFEKQHIMAGNVRLIDEKYFYANNNFLLFYNSDMVICENCRYSI